jgi:hypothetical protein
MSEADVIFERAYECENVKTVVNALMRLRMQTFCIRIEPDVTQVEMLEARG